MEFQGKQIIISRHAAERARLRDVVCPDHIYAVICTGKLTRFGKHLLKFVKRNWQGSIICICEDVGEVIVVKTVERGR